MHQWIKNSIWVVLFKFENRIWKLKMYNKDQKEKKYNVHHCSQSETKQTPYGDAATLPLTQQHPPLQLIRIKVQKHQI